MDRGGAKHAAARTSADIANQLAVEGDTVRHCALEIAIDDVGASQERLERLPELTVCTTGLKGLLLQSCIEQKIADCGDCCPHTGGTGVAENELG